MKGLSHVARWGCRTTSSINNLALPVTTIRAWCRLVLSSLGELVWNEWRRRGCFRLLEACLRPAWVLLLPFD